VPNFQLRIFRVGILKAFSERAHDTVCASLPLLRMGDVAQLLARVEL
jgi:hypothetical protein